MENPNFFQTITAIPIFALIGWVALALTAMYLARRPFHRSVNAFSRIIYNGMRLMASSVKSAERRMQERNRSVLLSSGLAITERRVEREFDRIGMTVQKEFEGFAQIKRKISEQLQTMAEDYDRCAVIPQNLPDWVKVIEAIANIKPSGDRMVVTMLEEIHHTLEEQHKTATDRHRRDIAERHGVLTHMQPTWRKLQKTLSSIENKIVELSQRSEKIDRYIDSYEKTLCHSDTAERQICASTITQFFVSAAVLCVATAGATINFNLIALPMSEMVGGASYIGGFKTADVAGMFIVSLEIVVGVFLMDALRVTRLFSVIGSLEDNKRKAIFWFLLIVLTVLALVGSSLAFMRDQVAADMEALRQSLAGVEISTTPSSRIPLIGQMAMGFILPFILIFVAIPFESFVASSRHILGVMGALLFRCLVLGLRLCGNFGYYLGRMVVNIYDLIIFPGLWLEGVILRKFSRSNKSKEAMDESAAKTDDVQIMKSASSYSEINK